MAMPRRCLHVVQGKGLRYRREKRTVHLRRRVQITRVSPIALEIQVDTAAPATPMRGRPKKPLIKMAFPMMFRRFITTETLTTSRSRV